MNPLNSPELITTTRIEGLDKPVSRKLSHRRTFCYEVYERDDGLWDIDAQMQDHKNRSIELDGIPRPIGEALHDMVLRLTLDNQMTIVVAKVTTVSSPYQSECPSINHAYEQLAGLNVMHGFRAALKGLFDGVSGCTHITELLNTLPTVAIQGIGFELAERQRAAAKNESVTAKEKPFPLDKCHALNTEGRIVKSYYPAWYKASALS